MSQQSGYLHIFIGGMFSGKTTNLIRKITKSADLSKQTGSKNPILINNTLDNRDNKNIISRHNSSYKGISKYIDVVSTKKLSDLNLTGYDVIGIDEGQLYTDLYETIVGWVNLGKIIFIAGLVGDSNQEHFGEIYKLLPKVNKIEFLTAFCHFCVTEYTKDGKILTPESLANMSASFTKKISGGNSQIDVGGSDKYLPSCRRHLWGYVIYY